MIKEVISEMTVDGKKRTDRELVVDSKVPLRMYPPNLNIIDSEPTPQAEIWITSPRTVTLYKYDEYGTPTDNLLLVDDEINHHLDEFRRRDSLGRTISVMWVSDTIDNA